MMTTGLLFFSGASFVIYGISCLTSAGMRAEFVRFGVARFRVLVGCLELAGGFAQLAHRLTPGLTLAATAGLCVLMLLGVITRLRVGDRWLVIVPAAGYMAINGWLLFALSPP